MRSVAQPHWGADMTAWITPRTWTSTVVTAADLNGEIRDHLNWLKGFADLITTSTASDTGTATYLDIRRTVFSDSAYRALVSGDTVARLTIRADGRLAWSSGAASADAFLERTGANALRATDTALTSSRAGSNSLALQATVTGDTTGRYNVRASGATEWSSGVAAADIGFSRTAPGILALGSLGAANISLMRVQAEVAQISGMDVLIVGDSAARARMRGDATLQGLEFGPGSAGADTNLYRDQPNVLKTDDHLRAANGLQTKVVAGAVSDGSFSPIAPASGSIALDTTNNRLYVRSGTVWKYVALI